MNFSRVMQRVPRIGVIIGGMILSSCAYITNERSIGDFSGPALARGVSPEVLAGIDLDDKIPALAGTQLRTRYWTVLPGGIFPVHSHEDRPAIIYVLSGEIYEYRNDRPEPVLHKEGGLSLEYNVAHWWINESDEQVILLATDIVKK